MSLPLIMDATFYEEVLVSKKTIAVAFVANWCEASRVLCKLLEELGIDSERLTVMTMDMDMTRHAKVIFDVTSLPTVLVFRSGRLIGRRSGPQASDTLGPWLLSHAAKPKVLRSVASA
ncbi:thioredoxin family protein [Woodsholea maritima]|uniref:thioredoxin family protein n=1 Tax=Woodsholea maritima TaxID=240237 RepID=UPI00037994CD|nr:thioredoxin family protein [Woodsholea maritima]